MKDCPTRNRARVPNQTAPTKGRVFTLSREEAKKDSNLVQGTCFLNQIPLNVLYDSGATHSFISYDCVSKLKLPVKPLSVSLSVSTPANIDIPASAVCTVSHLVIQHRVFSVVLVVFLFLV